MEVLQRLQPLDILFVVLWAFIVGWGLQTGIIRQIGMLVGVYGAAIASGSSYRQVGDVVALAFGRENAPLLQFGAYVGLFLVTLGVVALVLQRAYPHSRVSRRFGSDNVLGAVMAAIWGVLLLIALLTMLRYYVVVPWRDQEATQSSVLGQIQHSQLAPVLEVVAAPLWQAMVPWFPAAVAPSL